MERSKSISANITFNVEKQKRKNKEYLLNLMNQLNLTFMVMTYTVVQFFIRVKVSPAGLGNRKSD